jgi:hypothetical protein
MLQQLENSVRSQSSFISAHMQRQSIAAAAIPSHRDIIYSSNYVRVFRAGHERPRVTHKLLQAFPPRITGPRTLSTPRPQLNSASYVPADAKGYFLRGRSAQGVKGTFEVAPNAWTLGLDSSR